MAYVLVMVVTLRESIPMYDWTDANIRIINDITISTLISRDAYTI